ncbi:hypothetical protein HMPREF0497_1004 [Lentilactobacillus buchneri ATCC 11577]|uniref:Uncharacterized protein n=1 Tax=Lentilactobacillus hilgardii (strain ATCC 8290 / DSM 20176 / CCUG 30140 / JCM 1155 / KCTC 3500 / NBRC 15886 / NCIMB 8040 / NRRL B-1843 / 9) TaxID=1423757 RepID=C0XKF6_LENH9|nr:hypothetical protein HMPREF0497_1004 [Lentilactobacillus buchneri ATCC 11577]EEI24148.1 hypothetical protein HMPREF0519_1717 [Lentilactobacillus hilgardii DSM 20176 = ATCC 8290]
MFIRQKIRFIKKENVAKFDLVDDQLIALGKVLITLTDTWHKLL